MPNVCYLPTLYVIRLMMLPSPLRIYPYRSTHRFSSYSFHLVGISFNRLLDCRIKDVVRKRAYRRSISFKLLCIRDDDATRQKPLTSALLRNKSEIGGFEIRRLYGGFFSLRRPENSANLPRLFASEPSRLTSFQVLKIHLSTYILLFSHFCQSFLLCLITYLHVLISVSCMRNLKMESGNTER